MGLTESKRCIFSYCVGSQHILVPPPPPPTVAYIVSSPP